MIIASSQLYKLVMSRQGVFNPNCFLLYCPSPCHILDIVHLKKLQVLSIIFLNCLHIYFLVKDDLKQRKNFILHMLLEEGKKIHGRTKKRRHQHITMSECKDLIFRSYYYNQENDNLQPTFVMVFQDSIEPRSQLGLMQRPLQFKSKTQKRITTTK